ncbi:MAG TPA: carbohydrate kinase family protein [Gaiellaceae bacterium]|nr:carbohydrate kinase family protein [Gaiellaceae bacterium]
MRPLAVIGHLSRDVVAGGAPRIGGGPWHAARALRALRENAVLFAKCGESDRHRFRRELAATGLATSFSFAGTTTAFSMSYDEQGARTMAVEAIGEPWSASEPRQDLLRDVEWLHVAPLLRSDFDAETLARLGRGRRILLDGQGLVRVPQRGLLVLDDDFDRRVLRHVAILKLAEEEARAIAGDADLSSLASLGVPEIVVTFGLQGCLVLVRGTATHVPARPVHVDPTGSGDAFAAAYLAARAARHAPASAARRATAVVSALLSGSVR